MNRQLILVKHSLPAINANQPAREWLLSEEGKARAKRLAERLVHDQLDILATSPEPKARETTKILAARLGLSIQVLDDLHEHERSSVPYLCKPEFEAAVREFFENPDTLVFGSETANQAHERFSTAVYSLLSQNESSRIAFVSHGTVISLFVARIIGQSGFQIWSELGLPGFITLNMESKSLVALENIK